MFLNLTKKGYTQFEKLQRFLIQYAILISHEQKSAHKENCEMTHYTKHVLQNPQNTSLGNQCIVMKLFFKKSFQLLFL